MGHLSANPHSRRNPANSFNLTTFYAVKFLASINHENCSCRNRSPQLFWSMLKNRTPRITLAIFLKWQYQVSIRSIVPPQSAKPGLDGSHEIVLWCWVLVIAHDLLRLTSIHQKLWTHLKAYAWLVVGYPNRPPACR